MKWEYLLTNFNRTRERVVDELNRLGEEELEAVAILDDGHLLMGLRVVEWVNCGIESDLKGAWRADLKRFRIGRILAWCCDGNTKETSATVMGHVCIQWISGAAHGARSFR